MDASQKPIEKETSPEEGSEVIEKKSLLTQANETADRIEAGNIKREELLEREEKLHSERVLSGHADAGQAPPEKKPEISDADYAAKALRGDLNDQEE